MKIIAVRSRTERLPLSRPYTIAFGTFDAVEVTVLEVEADSGATGLGAASPISEITGESRQASAEALGSTLPDLLRGEDVRRLGGLLKLLERELPGLPAARAAADMALHDLFARHLGQPLVEVLGRCHESVATSVTIGILPPEEAAAEAREHVEGGFTILKVKTGDEVERDLEALARIREAVGEGPRIRVDANQGYSVDDLRAFAAGSETYGVELIEQPLPAGEVEPMRALPAALRRLAAADESLHSPADALALAAGPQPFGIFNIKLMKCGGVAPALEIAATARRAGIEVMWGSMDESAVSISAALHAALACPATRYLDLDGSFDLARDLAAGGFEVVDGRMRTLDAPGLGVRLVDGG